VRITILVAQFANGAGIDSSPAPESADKSPNAQEDSPPRAGRGPPNLGDPRLVGHVNRRL